MNRIIPGCRPRLTLGLYRLSCRMIEARSGIDVSAGGVQCKQLAEREGIKDNSVAREGQQPDSEIVRWLFKPPHSNWIVLLCIRPSSRKRIVDFEAAVSAQFESAFNRGPGNSSSSSDGLVILSWLAAASFKTSVRPAVELPACAGLISFQPGI
ncbi:MAG: hypothetical protein IPJ07_23215 [Acidobacteria bacterium]|nr:hypothetical protein [Acidobacteriota bacterium]